MTDTSLVAARIVAHGLHEPSGASVSDVVRSQLAMQGQDLPGVVSSIALRAGTDAQAVFDAFDRGEIVRAYPMRGTVFVMAAEDALWVGELCNAQQLKAQVKRRGQIGLDDHHFDTGRAELERRAIGGVRRGELFDAWNTAGIDTAGGRGYHMLSHFVQLGVATYGRWNGTDNDVHLAGEWLPADSTLEARFGGDRVAATAVLLERYFCSHGPATIRDAAWWTKLPLKLLRQAAVLLPDSMEMLAGEEPRYQRAGLGAEVEAAGRSIAAPRLLPGFDELVLGYPDRACIAGAADTDKLVPGGNGVFKPTAIAGGAVQGTWKRAGRPGKRSFVLAPWRAVSDTRMRGFERAFAAFPFASE